MKKEFIEKTIGDCNPVAEKEECGGYCSVATSRIATSIVGCRECDICSRHDGWCQAVADIEAGIETAFDIC